MALKWCFVDVYCNQEHIKWEWLAIREIHPETSLHLARKCFNMDINEWDWPGIIQQIGLVHERLSWLIYIYIHITNDNESSNPNLFDSIMPSVYQCTYLVGAALAMRVEPWRHWPWPCRQKKQSTSRQNKKISRQFKAIVYDDIQLNMLAVLYHHFTISI